MKDCLKRYVLLVVLALTSLAAWTQSIRVGVLLPLKEKSDRGSTLVEFYQGLLMAVEQAKTEGVSVDVHTTDCGTSVEQMQQVLTNNQLEQMDLIIGPVDAAQVPLLSEFCYKHCIRMILPFNTPCPQVYTNPYIYQVGVAQELLFPGISTLVINTLGDSRFVFCHSGESDTRAGSFSEHLRQVLNLRNIPTAQLNTSMGDFDCSTALSPVQNNVIVIDSRSRKALEQTLNGIKACQQGTQYKVTLLGYPEWMAYAQAMQRDFATYNAYLYTSYYRNPLSGRVLKFEQQYQKNFGKKSRDSYPRAEMLGYDLGYYFLHGLSTLGTYFDEQQGTLEQLPLQHAFRFQRVSEQGGYVNLHTQLVHYAPNNTVRIIQ